MDDILIATANPDDHILILQKLFNLLSRNKLKLKLSECHFLQTSIDYLGYMADCKGIRPNNSHIESLKIYPIPVNRRALQSCIGLFSYFCKFVPDFSRIAGPLYDLIKKDKPFHFDDKCEQAFIKIRDLLSCAPVLSIIYL